MSSSIRQTRLFAGEDFVSVYKSFQDIDFTAYDYDSIRDALIRNVQIHYPENFNDYIESSEFIAIIETLAYLGTSLAFRSDLNARDNIMDTAQRRQSIIRLARMINYRPKRNIAANGLFKILSVQTDQSLHDSNGANLSGNTITWNDQNNDDWYEQFMTVINAALNPTNPIGKPSKSGTVSGVTTDLYTMNNQLGLDVAYAVKANINGVPTPIDLINPDFGDILFERKPNQNEGFNLLYRNDKNGVSSADTGIFIAFRQGRLENKDFLYNFPVPNRTETINVPNINDTDVYVQEIDENGNVVEQWERVPSLYGNNIIYNTINFNTRKIFEVVSGENDTITIKFGDGNFADSPTGYIRVWYRVSSATDMIIRPDDIGTLKFRFPYIGKDNQRYGITFTFGLEYSVNNGAPSETNDQIKTRAPQVYYSQDRMINNQDYNVFPLTRGNEITKLKAINRRFAGHSRLDDVDPTGFNRGLTIFGEDGALYNQISNRRVVVSQDSTITGDLADITYNALVNFIRQRDVNNFYMNGYFPTLEQTQFTFDQTLSYWKTLPLKTYGSYGMFTTSSYESTPNWPYDDGISTNTSLAPFKYVKSGSILTFSDSSEDNKFSTSVRLVDNYAMPTDPSISEVGNVVLGSQVRDLSTLLRVIPPFRTSFNENESEEIMEKIRLYETFYIKYDVENDIWTSFTDGVIDAEYNPSLANSSWFVAVRFVPESENEKPYFELISRGIDTIFESYDNVKFYWDGRELIDGESSKTSRDTITILSDVNYTSSGQSLKENIVFSIDKNYIQSDGYIDDNKIIVYPQDRNEDGISDEPFIFTDLVSIYDEVVIENFIDEYGYNRTRPWYSRWIDMTNVYATDYQDVSIDLEDGVITFIGDPDIVLRLSEFDLLCLHSQDEMQLIVNALDSLSNDDRNIGLIDDFIATFKSKSMTIGVPNNRDNEDKAFYNFGYNSNRFIVSIIDPNHYSRNGRSFNLNKTEIEGRESLYYKWNHYVGGDQIVDPSPSNIINMIVLTATYYEDMVVWRREGADDRQIPIPPTSHFLKSNFSELYNYKSISDELIYNSCKFKILFGNGANESLKAKFKAIKLPSSNLSNNELKTGIVKAIDKYFDVNNWDFGESFYFTELAAFIHSQLSKHLSSVVIVPENNDAEFGDLFEITCKPDELFFSTATVDNVDIVTNFNNTNIRM